MAVDISTLQDSLSAYINAENERRISVYLRLFKKIMREAPLQRTKCLKLLQEGVSALLDRSYWLSLEVSANELPHDDDVVFRRSLHHFARAVYPDVIRPSVAMVYDTGIDILTWHRLSRKLGSDLSSALKKWDCSAELADSTRRANAQMAVSCLNKLCGESRAIEVELIENGLAWFESLSHFKKVFLESSIEDKHKKHQFALFSVLATYLPDKFSPIFVQINHKKVDVRDLADVSPVITEQLQTTANLPKYKGEHNHSVNDMTSRYLNCVTSLRKVFDVFPEQLGNSGLYIFKEDKFNLLKKVQEHLSRYQYAELVLFLELFFGHRIYKHDYQLELLPFYFKKHRKFRTVDYSRIAKKSPEVFKEIKVLHETEIALLEEKNYDMETLRTRFSVLANLLNSYLLPAYVSEFKEHGLQALSIDDNKIQRSLFQRIQSNVLSKKISRRRGTSYFEVVRWIMQFTGQPVVEAFKISLKRYQVHSRRSRMEDLYTNDEIRELAFYIEKGIRLATSEKHRVTLYFARIQLKTCWNTAPMADIELNDIKEVSLPTQKKAIKVLIQKPRKGYNIDCYSMDGRTLSSVMRDLQYVRDELTTDCRSKARNSDLQRYLFIYQEREKVSRLDHSNASSCISYLVGKLGCGVRYDSQRVRKTGTNYLYRDVAKNMRSYQDIKLHTFDTFIKNYQRIDESETQKNLHDAVSVMQKYFSGRDIDTDIKILIDEDDSLQKTPTGECASNGGDKEAFQYHKEHKQLGTHSSPENLWCGDYLACIWCKHFRTVADAEHVWQLLSYRDYVLADMSASMSDINNNSAQLSSFKILQDRVNEILEHISAMNEKAVAEGKMLLKEKGMHPFWSYAITSASNV